VIRARLSRTCVALVGALRMASSVPSMCAPRRRRACSPFRLRASQSMTVLLQQMGRLTLAPAVAATTLTSSDTVTSLPVTPLHRT
jgi:hypothetical protein